MDLSRRMPDLGAFEVFRAVAHSTSLSAAAQQLGVSQQAVSARIAALEAQTGVPLTVRTPQGSTLTAAGVTVAEWADRLLGMASEVDAGLAALRHDRRTRIRVSASLTIAEQLLPRWLVSFQIGRGRRDDGTTQVTLTATNSQHVIEDVRTGAADLGFIEGPQVPRGLRTRVVGHDTLVLVVRPDHPWARRTRTVPPAELLATGLVTREAGSGTRDAWERALRVAVGAGAPEASPVIALSTTSAVRAAVLEGAGPAVLSDLAVRDDLAAGRLRAIEVPGVDLTRRLRAVWNGPATPPAGAVRDLLAHIGVRR